MSPSSLFISLAQAAPQSAEQQLLDVDGTLFVMLGLFLLTMAVLTQFLWRPYLRVKEERVTRVEGYKEQASKMEADAQARLDRIQAELADARRRGSQELAKLRSEAHAAENQILLAAQTRAQADLAAARTKVEAALAAEKAKLVARAQELGHEAAARILGRKVSP